MRATNGYIAVDWGTTNRRAWAFDAAGNEIGRMSDGRGISSLARDAFAGAAREIRERLGPRPMLLGGMVGSNRGWVEAPYVRCPATLDGLVESLVAVPGEDAWIVPGVAYENERRCDVMRGEEVQLLGMIAAGLAAGDGLSCHPGTHSKWARLERGAITGFRTLMTGELFALLKAHSILAPQLGVPVEVDDAFRAGVDRALEGGELLGELFSLRARWLLQGLEHAQASAFASGLLIGTDVRCGLAMVAGADPVALVGEPRLTTLYAAAFEQAGRACRPVDGEAAFLGGIRAIAERVA